MQKAVSIVAHHDDHALWMGGTIQRLAASGWHWTVIAMCIPEPDKQNYFLHCCSVFGAIPIVMQFNDYQTGNPFSQNDRNEMKSRLLGAIDDQKFELVFTNSRGEHGEYWARHSNHVEVRELVAELVSSNTLGQGIQHHAYFSYDVIYGGGTAICATLKANYYLPLTYPELLWKCQLCSLAPDADSSLNPT
jgi:LmbE family N-acetylglucosaminyl deacetylase